MVAKKRKEIQTMKKVITVVLLTVAICAVNSMSEVVANEVEVIASGNRGKVDESSDGSNLTWTLDSKGALTISENKEETMSQIPEGYTPIYDITDLYAIRNNPSGNYILMNDIDMAEDTNEGGDWEQGNGWEAIETFSGVFDGNGYRIIGMHIFGEFYKGKRAGLFGQTDHAEICNLGIKDCNIDVTCNSNKSYYIGGIVGEALAGTIVKNCHVTGTMKIQGDSNNCGVGGLIGKAYVSSYYDEDSTNILIENSYNTCNIDCSEATAGRFAGGIIGYADAWYGNWKVNEYINYHGCIGMENVYNVGTITGNEWCVTQKDGTEP